VIYSIGSDEELAAVWAKLANLPDPAVSIHARYLAQGLPHLVRFKEEGVAVVTWPINDDALRLDLTERGVDGMTVDDLGVLGRIVAANGAEPT
jgi:glycerophosphoryl diester phosphodiesterase